MDDEGVTEALNTYLYWARAYVMVTRKYFESDEPVTEGARSWAQMALRANDQLRDACFGALRQAGLPVPEQITNEPPPPPPE